MKKLRKINRSIADNFHHHLLVNQSSMKLCKGVSSQKANV